jgi:hypothetical protein
VKFDLGEKNSLLFSGSSFLKPQAKRRRLQSLHVKSDTGCKLTRVREKPASRQNSPGNGGHNLRIIQGTVLRFPSENDPSVCAIAFVRSGSTAFDSELQVQLEFCLDRCSSGFSLYRPRDKPCPELATNKDRLV